jgi:hypothetical protein
MRFDVRARMARPRRVKKSQKDDHAQPSLPTGNAVPANGIRILPMQLRIGDRLTDETGEYEVIGRPYATAGGKTERAREASRVRDHDDSGLGRARADRSEANVNTGLDPLNWLTEHARDWIRAQRELHRPAARALNSDYQNLLEPFFGVEIFQVAGFRVVPALENPEFFAEAKALGIPVNIDFTQNAGVTFQDTILVSDAVEISDLAELVFHELVHVVQYQVLGSVDEFARQYVLGYATQGFDYWTIPLEAVAYELQHRFQADRATAFSVRAEIEARFTPGAP